MKLREFFFGKEEEKVEIPDEPCQETAWLATNFTFRWVTRLKDWGITPAEYTTERKKRKKDEETIFALYEKLIKKHKQNLLILQSIYYELAMMCAELGKDPKPHLIRSHNCILEHYQNTKKVPEVVIEANRDACPSCRKLDGWIVPLKEVEKRSLLPNKSCTKKHGKKSFCRCNYGPMGELK